MFKVKITKKGNLFKVNDDEEWYSFRNLVSKIISLKIDELHNSEYKDIYCSDRYISNTVIWNYCNVDFNYIIDKEFDGDSNDWDKLKDLKQQLAQLESELKKFKHNIDTTIETMEIEF